MTHTSPHTAAVEREVGAVVAEEGEQAVPAVRVVKDLLVAVVAIRNTRCSLHNW